MQAHLFLELWGPIFSFSSFWAGKCGASWRHGFAKREVTLFRFHRIGDFTTVGNHWKSLGIRLDIFPTWLQTQRLSAPKSIPSCIEVWSQTCFIFALFSVIWTKHWKAIAPQKKAITYIFLPKINYWFWRRLICMHMHMHAYASMHKWMCNI